MKLEWLELFLRKFGEFQNFTFYFGSLKFNSPSKFLEFDRILPLFLIFLCSWLSLFEISMFFVAIIDFLSVYFIGFFFGIMYMIVLVYSSVRKKLSPYAFEDRAAKPAKKNWTGDSEHTAECTLGNIRSHSLK